MENIKNLDLNLLKVFVATWQEQSVSKAAETLCLSQPAISHSLRKLREHFDDSLFVRSSKGVVPTDFAESLAPHVIESVQGLEKLLAPSSRFDSKSCRRTVSIYAGDLFNTVVLKKFVQKMREESPHVRARFFPVGEVFHEKELETGVADLVVTGYFASSKDKRGFYSKKVLTDSYSCLVRKDHPILGKTITDQSYMSFQHLNVSPLGRSLGVADERLNCHGSKQRDVAWVTAGFMEGALLIRESDLILTAPTSLCHGLAETFGLQSFPCPIQTRKFRAFMHWHDRTQMDAFHIWIRDALQEIFAEVSS